MSKKITLKERIDKVKGELKDLEEKKAPDWKIRKCRDFLRILTNKRDEIFARHKAKKHGTLLLRDVKVPEHQLNKTKKPKPKKVYTNPILDDMKKKAG